MLERQTSPDGVVTYRSRLLADIGVPHAFSTRLGGGSPAPFDSLNLGNPNGCDIQDRPERIRDNYCRLLRAGGCDDRELVWLWQIHGSRTIRLDPATAHDNDTKADALVTRDSRRVLSVRVADCVPVLVSADDGRTVAAIHAGWRGVVAGVVVEALKQLEDLSEVSSRRVTAAIGPSIGFDSFEVGPDVLDEFTRIFKRDAPIRRRPDGKGHVDLRESLRRQLIAAGVRADRVDTTDRCTYRDADEFFSHRRENGVTGRMAAIIAAAE